MAQSVERRSPDPKVARSSRARNESISIGFFFGFFGIHLWIHGSLERMLVRPRGSQIVRLRSCNNLQKDFTRLLQLPPAPPSMAPDIIGEARTPRTTHNRRARARTGNHVSHPPESRLPVLLLCRLSRERRRGSHGRSPRDDRAPRRRQGPRAVARSSPHHPVVGRERRRAIVGRFSHRQCGSGHSARLY